MKRFVLSVLLLALSSFAFADTDQAAQPTIKDQAVQVATDAAKKAVVEVVKPKTAQTPEDQKKLDSRVQEALKLTEQQLANMSTEEKEKVLDDLKHPDGKTVGQGMALFGKELGQGLGSAVKEVGATFNDFANSGVGRITLFIIFWKFFGHAFLWFILICILLKGLGKFLKNIFGQYTPEGKFIKLDLMATSKLDDGVVFGIWILIAFVLVAVVVGAAINF